MEIVNTHHVTRLNDSKTMANSIVVQRLEEVLELAKQGKAINCAVLLINDDETIQDGWANPNNPYAMVGALEALKQDFMNSNIEKRK